jgi:hypothetical protein
MRTADDDFFAQCAALDGAALGEGAFSPGPALWVGTREVAHVDHDGVLDVRLTRRVVREHRPALRADPRVHLRANASDWIGIEIVDEADHDWALGLIELAVAANLPTATPGLPPEGTELARRRRFH